MKTGTKRQIGGAVVGLLLILAFFKEGLVVALLVLITVFVILSDYDQFRESGKAARFRYEMRDEIERMRHPQRFEDMSSEEEKEWHKGLVERDK
jgi:hypothetical protein